MSLPPTRALVRDHGVSVFLVVAGVLPAAVALAFDPSWADAATTAPARLLRASLAYAGVLGLPPLLAVLLARRIRRPAGGQVEPVLPLGSKGALRGIALAWLVLMVAIAWALRHEDAPSSSMAVRSGGALEAVAVFAVAAAVLWLQALTEEVAWRGYLLPRLIGEIGSWRGLVVHGVLWGASYAAAFAALHGTSDVRAGELLVTCTLLGIALGWVRLASGGVLASAAANAMISLGGGLPLVLHGMSPPTGVVFGPVGWLPLCAIALVVRARVAEALR